MNLSLCGCFVAFSVGVGFGVGGTLECSPPFGGFGCFAGLLPLVSSSTSVFSAGSTACTSVSGTFKPESDPSL